MPGVLFEEFEAAKNKLWPRAGGPSKRGMGPVCALAPLSPLIVITVPLGPERTVLAIIVTVSVFREHGYGVDCPIRF